MREVTYFSTNSKNVSKAQSGETELNKLSKEVQTGDHGTALEERREDEAKCVGKDVLLDHHHGAGANVHHRA